MSKQNNLKDYLTDLYEGIASKKPGASKNPQDFRSEIEAIGTKAPSEWQAETVYYPNDIVIYNGVYYICIMVTQQGAVLQTPDITPTWWERINGEYKGEYDSTKTYSVGDIVAIEGSVYQAIVDNPQTPPDNDMANHWTVIHKCEVEGEIVDVWNGKGITVITL